MIVSFADRGTEDIFDGISSKAARKILPMELHINAARKLDWINRPRNIEVLNIPPSNRLESLRGDLAGFWSIRINGQCRIIFRWKSGNALNVRVTDYH